MLVREMNLHSPIDVCDWFSCLPAPQQHIMLTGFVSVLRLGATDVNGDDRPQTQTHMQTQSQTQSQSQSQSRSRRVLGDGYGAVPCVGRTCDTESPIVRRYKNGPMPRLGALSRSIYSDTDACGADSDVSVDARVRRRLGVLSPMVDNGAGNDEGNTSNSVPVQVPVSFPRPSHSSVSAFTPFVASSPNVIHSIPTAARDTSSTSSTPSTPSTPYTKCRVRDSSHHYVVNAVPREAWSTTSPVGSHAGPIESPVARTHVPLPRTYSTIDEVNDLVENELINEFISKNIIHVEGGLKQGVCKSELRDEFLDWHKQKVGDGVQKSYSNRFVSNMHACMENHFGPYNQTCGWLNTMMICDMSDDDTQ
jgi:hypothetical protein